MYINNIITKTFNFTTYNAVGTRSKQMFYFNVYMLKKQTVRDLISISHLNHYLSQIVNIASLLRSLF